MTDHKRIFKTLFVNKTDNIFLLMFRYMLVTGVAYLINFLIFFALTRFAILKPYYIYINIFASLVGGVVNYLMSIAPQVFGRSKIKSPLLEFMVFTAIGGIGLGLDTLVLWVFTKHFTFPMMMAKIVAVIAVFLWTFFARRALFQHEHVPEDNTF